jgi:hypothetical protein
MNIKGGKKLKIKLLCAVLALVVALTLTGTALAAPTLSKASGGGIVEWGGGNVTYGFTAKQVTEEGNATGQAQFHFRDIEVSAHVDVLYLKVDTSTGEAWIGGNITKSTDAAYVGMEVYWIVQDNGEGGKASGPDMVSSVVIAPAITALSKLPLPLIEWTHGNVQVK